MNQVKKFVKTRTTMIIGLTALALLFFVDVSVARAANSTIQGNLPNTFGDGVNIYAYNAAQDSGCDGIADGGEVFYGSTLWGTISGNLDTTYTTVDTDYSIIVTEGDIFGANLYVYFCDNSNNVIDIYNVADFAITQTRNISLGKISNGASSAHNDLDNYRVVICTAVGGTKYNDTVKQVNAATNQYAQYYAFQHIADSGGGSPPSAITTMLDSDSDDCTNDTTKRTGYVIDVTSASDNYGIVIAYNPDTKVTGDMIAGVDLNTAVFTVYDDATTAETLTDDTSAGMGFEINAGNPDGDGTDNDYIIYYDGAKVTNDIHVKIVTTSNGTTHWLSIDEALFTGAGAYDVLVDLNDATGGVPSDIDNIQTSCNVAGAGAPDDDAIFKTVALHDAYMYDIYMPACSNTETVLFKKSGLTVFTKTAVDLTASAPIDVGKVTGTAHSDLRNETTDAVEVYSDTVCTTKVSSATVRPAAADGTYEIYFEETGANYYLKLIDDNAYNTCGNNFTLTNQAKASHDPATKVSGQRVTGVAAVVIDPDKGSDYDPVNDAGDAYTTDFSSNNYALYTTEADSDSYVIFDGTDQTCGDILLIRTKDLSTSQIINVAKVTGTTANVHADLTGAAHNLVIYDTADGVTALSSVIVNMAGAPYNQYFEVPAGLAANIEVQLAADSSKVFYVYNKTVAAATSYTFEPNTKVALTIPDNNRGAEMIGASFTYRDKTVVGASARTIYVDLAEKTGLNSYAYNIYTDDTFVTKILERLALAAADRTFRKISGNIPDEVVSITLTPVTSTSFISGAAGSQVYYTYVVDGETPVLTFIDVTPATIFTYTYAGAVAADQDLDLGKFSGTMHDNLNGQTIQLFEATNCTGNTNIKSVAVTPALSTYTAYVITEYGPTGGPTAVANFYPKITDGAYITCEPTTGAIGADRTKTASFASLVTGTVPAGISGAGSVFVDLGGGAGYTAGTDPITITFSTNVYRLYLDVQTVAKNVYFTNDNAGANTELISSKTLTAADTTLDVAAINWAVGNIHADLINVGGTTACGLVAGDECRLQVWEDGAAVLSSEVRDYSITDIQFYEVPAGVVDLRVYNAAETAVLFYVNDFTQTAGTTGTYEPKNKVAATVHADILGFEISQALNYTYRDDTVAAFDVYVDNTESGAGFTYKAYDASFANALLTRGTKNTDTATAFLVDKISGTAHADLTNEAQDQIEVYTTAALDTYDCATTKVSSDTTLDGPQAGTYIVYFEDAGAIPSYLNLRINSRVSGTDYVSCVDTEQNNDGAGASNWTYAVNDRLQGNLATDITTIEFDHDGATAWNASATITSNTYKIYMTGTGDTDIQTKVGATQVLYTQTNTFAADATYHVAKLSGNIHDDAYTVSTSDKINVYADWNNGNPASVLNSKSEMTEAGTDTYWVYFNASAGPATVDVVFTDLETVANKNSWRLDKAGAGANWTGEDVTMNATNKLSGKLTTGVASIREVLNAATTYAAGTVAAIGANSAADNVDYAIYYDDIAGVGGQSWSIDAYNATPTKLLTRIQGSAGDSLATAIPSASTLDVNRASGDTHADINDGGSNLVVVCEGITLPSFSTFDTCTAVSSETVEPLAGSAPDYTIYFEKTAGTDYMLQIKDVDTGFNYYSYSVFSALLAGDSDTLTLDGKLTGSMGEGYDSGVTKIENVKVEIYDNADAAWMSTTKSYDTDGAAGVQNGYYRAYVDLAATRDFQYTKDGYITKNWASDAGTMNDKLFAPLLTLNVNLVSGIKITVKDGGENPITDATVALYTCTAGGDGSNPSACTTWTLNATCTNPSGNCTRTGANATGNGLSGEYYFAGIAAATYIQIRVTDPSSPAVFEAIYSPDSSETSNSFVTSASTALTATIVSYNPAPECSVAVIGGAGTYLGAGTLYANVGQDVILDVNCGETGLTLTADLSAIGGGAAQALTDDGDNTYSYTQTVGAVATGSKAITVTASDGINTDVDIINVTVDNTAPGTVTAVVDPGATDTDGVVTWTWTAATDANSGIKDYEVKIATNATCASGVLHTDYVTDLSYTYGGLVDGSTYYACVLARDNVGNEGTAVNSDGITIDTSVPNQVVLSIPEDGAYSNDTTPDLTWFDIDGETGYEIQIDDDGTFTGDTGDFENSAAIAADIVSYTVTGPMVTGSTYHWRVRALDSTGDNGPWSQTRSLIIDTGTPSITVTNLTAQNSRSFTVTATEGSSETGLTCKMSTQNVAYAAMEEYLADLGTGVYQGTMVVPSDGTYTIYAACRDAAANTGTDATDSSFAVDAVAPTVTVATPQGGTYNTAQQLSVTTDTASTCYYSTSDVSYDAMVASLGTIMVDGASVHTATPTPGADGLIHYYVKCSDDAISNDMLSSVLLYYTYDTTAPTYELISISSNGDGQTAAGVLYANSGDVITLKFQASEALAGNPTVTIGAQVMTYSSVLGSNIYTYTRTLNEDETTTAVIAISGQTDSAGNGDTDYGDAGANVEFDFTAPTFTETTAATFNTKSVLLTGTADETATCRFDTTDIAYSAMAYSLGPINETSFAANYVSAEGAVTLYARCMDLSGNAAAASVSITYTVDSIAPTVTVATPQGGTYNTAQQIAVTTDENANCRYATSDISYTAMTVGNQFTGGEGGTAHTVTPTPGAQGLIHYYVRCVDTAQANEMASSVVIYYTYDTTAPTYELISISSNGNGQTVAGVLYANSGDTITLKFQASETMAGNPTVTIGTKAVTYSSVLGSNIYTYTRLLDGTETLTAVIAISGQTDSAGNGDTDYGDAGANVEFDFTAATLTTPLPTTTQTTLTFTGSVVGGATGLDCRADVNNVVHGSMAYNMTDLGTNTYSALITVSADGSYTIYFACKDYAGNIGTSNTGAFTVDTTAPTESSIIINSGADYSTSSTLSLVLYATNANEMNFSCDGSTWTGWEAYATTKSFALGTVGGGCATADGDKIVYFKTRDANNNEAATVYDEIYLDGTAPTIGVLTAANTQTQKEVTLTWTAAIDAQSGVDHYDVYRKNATGVAKTDTLVASGLTTLGYLDYPEDGAWYYTVYATDKAGNESTLFVEKTVTVDTTAPTSVVISIAGGAEYTTAAAVTITTGASGATLMQFSCDNSNWTVAEAYAASKAFNLESQAGAGCSAGDGVKWVYVKMLDAYGNNTVLSDDITLDSTAPVITASTPVIAVSGGQVTVTWTTATDATSGVAIYNVYRKASTPVATSDTKVVSGLTDLGFLDYPTDGDWYYAITASDFAGNTSVISGTSLVATVDTQGPEPVVITIDSDALYNNSATLTLTLVTGGAANMQFSCDGSNWTVAEAAATSKSLVLATAGAGCTATDGLKLVIVKMIDASNNATYASDYITLDTALDTDPSSLTPGVDVTQASTSYAWSWAPAADAGSALWYHYVEISNDAGATWTYATDDVFGNTFTLSGLAVNSTGYMIRVTGYDIAGNSGAVVTSAGKLFIGNTATITSVVASSITNTTATVTWTTSVNSTSNTVEYGLTSALGSTQAASTGDGVASHSASLTGLTADRTYYYRVKSTAAGVTTYSDIVTFATAADTTNIAVDSIQMIKTYATADDTYANGWKWSMNISVWDTTETSLKMKFTDWASGANTITMSGNMRIGLTNEASAASDATIIAATQAVGNAYTDQATALTLVDANASKGGIQDTIYLYMQVPAGSAGGAYSTSYGIYTY